MSDDYVPENNEIIEDTALILIAMAAIKKRPVTASFNGALVRARPGSLPEDVVEMWRMRHDLLEKKKPENFDRLDRDT